MKIIKINNLNEFYNNIKYFQPMQNEEKNKVLQEFEGLLSTLKTQNNNSNALRDKLINLIRIHIDPHSEYIRELKEKRGAFYREVTVYENIIKITEENLNYAETVIKDSIQHIKSHGLYTPPVTLPLKEVKKPNFLSRFDDSTLIAILTLYTALAFYVGKLEVQRIPVKLPSFSCPTDVFPNNKSTKDSIQNKKPTHNGSPKVN